MAIPPNHYTGGIPGRRTSDVPPNPYHCGMPGQRSPWGHSSPRHFTPRHCPPMQATPTNHWEQSPQHPVRSRFTPPQFTPNYSPIPHHQSFQTPYSSKRGQDSRGRNSSGGGSYSPHGDRKHGQKFHSKDRRSSGCSGGGRGGYRRGSDVPVEKYFREDMLKDPWADLNEKEGGPPTT
ncbi:hypothetical protein HOLleu_34700 [Holothuria leucospilota]|uniref:Uncharacterized protein n=1 Tax=Holothuria leucospilota TaxID=206669 RepID=A0A9Q1BEE1_HOLLE|nr:hypothetical protein HOLleu_34700 [Holothuria leucospilota]